MEEMIIFCREQSMNWLGAKDVPQVLLLGCASVTCMGRLGLVGGEGGELGSHGESGTRMLDLRWSPVPM